MSQTSKQLEKDSFKTDIFTVPFKDGYILYIPVSGIVAGVEKRVHELIQSIKHAEPLENNFFNRQWLNALSEIGVFEPRETESEELGEFLPTHVTLSLTSRCQLRCVYCYARAAEDIRDIDEEIMVAALTLVANNAVKKGDINFGVTFHGEGEPTANWPLFCIAIDTAKKIAEERGLEVGFSMSTNAMWTKRQREFIADNFKFLSISLDGPPDVQNSQRPMVNGAPSFSIVFDNLKGIENAGVEYALRPTVMDKSIGGMLPFLDMVAAKLKCNMVDFEPVCTSGRAAFLKVNRDDFFRRFCDSFYKAVMRGSELGILVEYSGCRSDYCSANFCGVSGLNPNFFVTTRGIVSSCYAIENPDTPKGRFAVYGHYDRVNDKFVFDERKLQRIRNFGVNKLEHCRDCFVRWNCSGDCFASSDLDLDEDGNVIAGHQSPKCSINRETTLYSLVGRALMLGAQNKTKKLAGAKKE